MKKLTAIMALAAVAVAAIAAVTVSVDAARVNTKAVSVEGAVTNVFAGPGIGHYFVVDAVSGNANVVNVLFRKGKDGVPYALGTVTNGTLNVKSGIVPPLFGGDALLFVNKVNSQTNMLTLVYSGEWTKGVGDK